MDNMKSSNNRKFINKIQFCSLQGVGEFNEDAWVINEQAHIYGVIDGATSISNPRRKDGKTGGYIAAQLLAEAGNFADPDKSLKQLVLDVNLALRQRMIAEGIDICHKEELWTAAFVLFKMGPTSVEYVQAGDCMLYAKYRGRELRSLSRDQVRPFDRITLLKRSEAISQGYTSSAEIMEYVKPYINANRRKTNTLEGYSVLNGELEFEHFLETGTVSRAGLTKLYAITDGLQYPIRDEQSLEDEPNTHLMLDIIDRVGLRMYASSLIAIEQQDPNCEKYVRHKVSDDKTGVVIDLSQDNVDEALQ